MSFSYDGNNCEGQILQKCRSHSRLSDPMFEYIHVNNVDNSASYSCLWGWLPLGYKHPLYVVRYLWNTPY